MPYQPSNTASSVAAYRTSFQFHHPPIRPSTAHYPDGPHHALCCMYCRSFSTLGCTLLKIRTGPCPHPLARGRMRILAQSLTVKSDVDVREPVERSLMSVVRHSRHSMPDHPSNADGSVAVPPSSIRPNTTRCSAPPHHTLCCMYCRTISTLGCPLLQMPTRPCPHTQSRGRHQDTATGSRPTVNLTWTCVNPLTPQVCPSVSAQKRVILVSISTLAGGVNLYV